MRPETIPAIPAERQRRIDMLRAAGGYVSRESRPYLMMDECAALGHPAKYDFPPEIKPEGKRGCVCGRDQFA